MKIGNIEVKKIPPFQSIECENACSTKAVAYLNDRPYCAECLREEQKLTWDKDGNFFETSEGERVYFDVVQTVKTESLTLSGLKLKP